VVHPVQRDRRRHGHPHGPEGGVRHLPPGPRGAVAQTAAAGDLPLPAHGFRDSLRRRLERQHPGRVFPFSQPDVHGYRTGRADQRRYGQGQSAAAVWRNYYDGGDGGDSPVQAPQVLVERRTEGFARPDEHPPARHEVDHGDKPERERYQAHEGRVDAETLPDVAEDGAHLADLRHLQDLGENNDVQEDADSEPLPSGQEEKDCGERDGGDHVDGKPAPQVQSRNAPPVGVDHQSLLHRLVEGVGGAADGAGSDAPGVRRLRAAGRLGAAGPASVAGHDIRAAAAQMAEVWATLDVRA